ncbi:cytochrome C [Novosphingobium sp.]|uniref:cytochrome C n=1 Tax=Novosphingobium sp. TaxID=1874826 RepID=UPI0031D41D73
MARGFALLFACVLSLASAQGSASSGAPARPVHYVPRADPLPAALSDGEGQVVAANCSACHSLDYITTQPRGKGIQFWRDEVTKMVSVYKAPIAPADSEAVAATLGRKFGGAG